MFWSPKIGSDFGSCFEATRAIGKRSKISVEPEDWDEAIAAQIWQIYADMPPSILVQKDPDIRSWELTSTLYIYIVCWSSSVAQPHH